MAGESLYTSHARLYDRIYARKQYRRESAGLHRLLVREGVPEGSAVLEVGCGTGRYLQPLSEHFAVRGLDLSPEMVALARQRVPDVPLEVGDLAELTVTEPLDALLCLHGAVAYLPDLPTLEQATARFHAALRPGGCLLLHPVGPELVAGTLWMNGFREEGAALAWMAHMERGDDGHAELEFQWLAGRGGEGIEHGRDVHRLRLFTRAEIAGALAAAGFELRFDPDELDDRGLWIARRRA